MGQSRVITTTVALAALLGAATLGATTTAPDTGKPTVTVDADRLALTICRGQEVEEIQPPGTPWTMLACETPCRGDWKACVTDDDERDAAGRPLQRVAFTVDGQGGFLRWSDNGKPPKAALFIHSGGPGTDFRDTDKSLWGPLQADGLRTIAVRWHPGVIDPATGQPAGWLAKTDGSPEYHSDSSGKVAAIIHWAHEHVVPDSAPFGLFGTSNGGLATVAAVVWHDLDPIIDYHFISSGALNWDMGARCKAQVGDRPATGLCENAPLKDCRADKDCGGNNDRCAWPAMSTSHAHRIDYRLDTPGDCVAGKSNARMGRTSLNSGGVDLRWDHPVDFVVAEGKGGNMEDDTLEGFTWQAGMLYRNLEIDHPLGKRWVDLHGYGHGQGSGHPDVLPQLACAFRRGLDLKPCP